MTAAETQILTMFEELGLPIEVIKEQVPDFDESSIKICLTKYSARYRTEIKSKRDFGFTDSDREKAREVIADRMLSADEHLSFKAAKYIRDDTEGRLDIYNESKNPSSALGKVSIVQFNITLQKANEALKRTQTPPKEISAPKQQQQQQQQLTEVIEV